MNKKIFMLLFFLLVLMSVSAVSAANLDDNNDTIVLSDDADMLSAANDVDAIGDLNENDADSGDKALQNDARSVAAGEDNEIYSEGYEEAEGDLMSPVLNEGEYTIHLEFSQYYDPQKTTVTGYIERYDQVPIFEGLLTINVDGHQEVYDFVENEDDFTFDIGSLDAGQHDWEADFQDISGSGEYGTGNGKFTIKPANTAIDISESSIEMLVGETKATGAQLNPSGAGELNYSSSNPDVADVSKNETGAYIIANCPGTATITVSFNGSKNYAAAESQTITVTVTPPKTIYVNATANQGGDGSEAAPFNTLKDALDVAEDGDTIMIASGTYVGVNNTNLTIDKKLSFEKYGDGEAVLDAQEQNGIFTVNAATINISGLTFKNGKRTGNTISGGAIYIENALSDSTINAKFINNTAVGGNNLGGAIYFESAVDNVRIYGEFINNTADLTQNSYGGAIAFHEVLSNSIINATFINNSAEYYGGAVYSENAVMNVEIYGEFINNTADRTQNSYGGAIALRSTVSDSIINATFIDNTANKHGGAISFTQNSYIENFKLYGKFINNRANVYGGAIYSTNSISDSIINATFINNTAADGGANMLMKALTNVNITSDFINNTATGNDKESGGGANYFNDVLTNVIMSGNFIGNSADPDSDGGGVNYFYRTVTNLYLTGNFINNKASNGVNFFFKYVQSSIIDATFINNTASGNGSAICIKDTLNESVIVGTFINNTGDSVIFIKSCNPSSAIHDSIFINNDVDKIIDSNGTVRAVNNWFGNNATNYNEAPANAGIDLENWLFLNATANPNEIKLGESSTIAFNLYSNTSPEEVYDAFRMNIKLDLSQTLGELDKSTASIGEEITYTAEDGGDASVTATFETASYTLSLKNKVLATIYVNATADQGGNGSETAPFNTLKDALDVAQDDDTIMIAAGTYTGNNNTLLIINQNNLNLIKYGDGEAIFDAESTNRDNIFIFDTNDGPKSVNIKGLTFKNTDFYAITFNGPNAMTDSSINATFTNIGNGKWGSAIFARHADNIDITGTFINNSAGEGLIKIFNDANNIEIHDSIFINNGESSIFAINGSSLIYNNWFGNTADDWNITPTGVDNVHMINWLFLNATADPSEIGIGKSSTITFDMYYLNFGAINKYDGPLNIQMDLTQTLGELDKTAASLGEEITYTAKNAGDASVTATFETASYTINLKNSGIPTELDLNLDVPAEYSTWDEVWITGYVLVNGTEEKVKKGSVDMYINDEFVKTIKVDEEWGIDGGLGVLDAGNYTIKAVYHDDAGEYMGCEWTNSFEIMQAATEIALNTTSIELIIADSANIEAALSPSEAGNLIYSSNDTNVVTVNENGDVVAVGAGTATITVSFEGNKNYAAAEEKTVAVTVNKIGTDLTSSDVNVVYNTDDYLIATLKDAFGNPIVGARVGFANNGVKYFFTDENGEAKYSTKDLAEGDYTVRIKYYGNGTYEASNQAVAKISVGSNATFLNASDVNVVYNTDDYLVATLTDAFGNPIVGARVGFANNGVKYVFTDENGQAKYSTKDLAEGTYTVRIKYYGNDVYAASNQAVAKVSVGSNATFLSACDTNVFYNTDDYLVATLMDAFGNPIVGARVGFANNGVKYFFTDENGEAKYPTKDLALGDYTVRVKYYGNGTYEASNQAVAKISVGSNATFLNASDVHVVYNADDYLVATLKDAFGNPIVGARVGFANNGVTYVFTDENGQAKYSTKDLALGDYTVRIKYYGNDVYAASNQAVVKVSVGSNATFLDASDTNVIYNADGYLVATLKDSFGNPIVGARVGFANNGVKYVFTDENGEAKYSTKDLAEGIYTVRIKYYGDGTYAASDQVAVKVSVGSNATFLNASDTSVAYGADEYLIATLKDSFGSPIAGARIAFVNNGFTYAVTDEFGVAKYSTKDLDMGSYTVRIQYYGNKVYAVSNQVIARVTVASNATLLSSNESGVAALNW